MASCTCDKNCEEDAWLIAQDALAMLAWISWLISLGFLSLFLNGVNVGPCFRGLLWGLYEMVSVNAPNSACHIVC